MLSWVGVVVVDAPREHVLVLLIFTCPLDPSSHIHPEELPIKMARGALGGEWSIITLLARSLCLNPRMLSFCVSVAKTVGEVRYRVQFPQLGPSAGLVISLS